MTSASEKINVIPSRASVRVDCRTPPGIGEDVVRRRIEEILGADGYELEFTEQIVGNGSAIDSPLMDAIRGWLAREDPDARVVPIVLPGVHRLAHVPRRRSRSASPTASSRCSTRRSTRCGR